MKKTGNDLAQIRIDAGSKDKRTLVLFLLGSLLLSLPLLFPELEPLSPVYAIIQATGNNQWQVVSLPGKSSDTKSSLEKRHFFSQQAYVVHLFSEAYTQNDLPVELAMFFNRPLPLNKSGQADLEMLPGIGPRLATMIIAERLRKGRFAGPEDLLDVPGIGPANLQRILPLVSFE
jgi:DNA uptake protein ComE-like DNA-binding protein